MGLLEDLLGRSTVLLFFVSHFVKLTDASCPLLREVVGIISLSPLREQEVSCQAEFDS